MLLDTLGCAIAGFSNNPPLQRFAESLGRGGRLGLPGLPLTLGPSQLGQVMATAACWDEACEGLARAHGRPGLHAVPAALAVGVAEDATLDGVLKAIVAGYEIGGRLGEVLRIRPGMHVDGTWGTIAAAVAARAVTHVHATSLVRAVDAAACGIPASLYAPISAGSTLRNLYAGQGVARGIDAAAALASGIEAPPGALDDVAGILFEREPDRALAAAGTWLIAEGYFKPFAAVRHVHYGAQAALDWRGRQEAPTADITGLALETYPEAMTYCGNRAPRTAIQAQFSLSYGAAHALVRGALGPEAYRPEALTDPETVRLESLLQVTVGHDFPAGRGARLTIAYRGREAAVEVVEVMGDPARPMPAAAVQQKFVDYSASVLGAARSKALAEAVMTASGETPIAQVLAP